MNKWRIKMKLRDSDLEVSIHREAARYCVLVRYNKNKVIKEIKINPITSNGHYPIDRTYEIRGQKIKRTIWDDEWHISTEQIFNSVNDIPDNEMFSYLDEGAYDGELVKSILGGTPLEDIAEKFEEISLHVMKYKKRV